MCFKLVTFDITGTLLKGRKPVGETYAQAGKLFGVTEVHSDKIAASFENEWTKMCEAHPNYGLYSGLGWESWWKNIVRSTFINSTSKKLSDDSLNNLSSYLIHLYSTKNGWSCEEGAIDLLQHLKLNKVEIGVISNFDIRLANILRELGLYNYFSFVLTSYETSYLKPDIKIFKMAQSNYEAKTGLSLQEAAAVHVGNSLEHDVEGARAAGWKSVLISKDSNVKNEVKTNDVIIFKNLKEFYEYLVLNLNYASQ